MNKTIHELNSLAQAQADDEFIIYDVSEGESKKIQVQALTNPNYSTEEQKTGGTWIDGKPIYRKVLTFPNGVNCYNQWGILKDVENEKLCLSAIWSTVTPAPNNYIVSGNAPIAITSANKIAIHVSTYTESQVVRAVIIEYTKTTD